MLKLVILADDLTGALDTGVQFAAAGVRTAVTVGLTPAPNCTVSVCDLETRQLSSDEAYARTKTAVQNARSMGADYFYVKTDSGLRGQIGAELAALQEVFPRVLFAPAYPENHRITRGGIHLIGGVPVSRSLFGQDARTPVRHDRVADILRASRPLPVRVLPEYSALPAAPGVVLADAVTDAALTFWATSGKSAGIRAYAGCAGFARALEPILDLPRTKRSYQPAPAPVLTVCGSISPVSRAQLAAAEAAGIPCHRLRDALSDNAAALFTDLKTHGTAILASVYADADLAENTRAGETAETIAVHLGSLTARAVAEYPALTLCLIGGDTLMAATQALPDASIRPVRELSSGTVLCELTSGGTARPLITKSGSFGDADVIVRIVEEFGKTQEIPHILG